MTLSNSLLGAVFINFSFAGRAWKSDTKLRGANLAGWWKKFKDSCTYLIASFAIVLVKRKLSRRPYDWSLWLTLGRLYAVGYQWPQAIDSLKRARKLNPQSEVIAQVLANAKEAGRQKGVWPPVRREKGGGKDLGSLL
jgi:hypothetical protein